MRHPPLLLLARPYGARRKNMLKIKKEVVTTSAPAWGATYTASHVLHEHGVTTSAPAWGATVLLNKSW